MRWVGNAPSPAAATPAPHHRCAPHRLGIFPLEPPIPVVICANGTRYNTAARRCENCTAGSWSTGGNRTQPWPTNCTACPAGVTTTFGIYASSVDDCKGACKVEGVRAVLDVQLQGPMSCPVREHKGCGAGTAPSAAGGAGRLASVGLACSCSPSRLCLAFVLPCCTQPPCMPLMGLFLCCSASVPRRHWRPFCVAGAVLHLPPGLLLGRRHPQRPLPALYPVSLGQHHHRRHRRHVCSPMHQCVCSAAASTNLGTLVLLDCHPHWFATTLPASGMLCMCW